MISDGLAPVNTLVCFSFDLKHQLHMLSVLLPQTAPHFVSLSQQLPIHDMLHVLAGGGGGRAL